MTHIVIFREEPIDPVATPMEDVIEDLQDFSSWDFFFVHLSSIRIY